MRSEAETTPITIRKFGARTSLGSEPRLIIDYSAPAMPPTVPPTIFGVALVGNQIRFSFNAESNRTYAVEFQDSLAATNWAVLTNIPAQSANTSLDTTNTMSSLERYFRIRTP